MFSYTICFVLMYFVTANGTVLHRVSRYPRTSRVVGKSELCSTSVCETTAKFYLSYMDTTVDPCEDFYKFACGNFIKQHKSAMSSKDVFTFAQKSVNAEISEQLNEEFQPTELATFRIIKTYYQSCMDTNRLEEDGTRPILELLESFGGWPIVTGNKWDEGKFDFIDSLRRLREKNYPISFPFGLSVAIDTKDSSQSILQMEYPLTYDRKVAADPEILPDAFLNFIKSTSAVLSTHEPFNEDAKTIKKFELDLYFASVPLRPTTMTIEELSKQVPSLPWMTLFNLILNPSGIHVNENERILVNLRFCKELAKLIRKTPKRTLANYLGWSVVSSLMPYLPEKLRSLYDNFKNVEQGKSIATTRELFCLKDVRDKFVVGLSSMYVRKYFHSGVKADVQELFEAVRSQTRKSLQEIDWLDDETRQQALDKLDAMRSNIIYADELLDDQRIDDYYRELEISPRQFLTNALTVLTFESDQTYKNLRVDRNLHTWKMMKSSLVANAYYHPQLNLVDVTAGLLRYMLYHWNRPKYLNFGIVGTAIAHEIVHAYDVDGRRFDKKGNQIDWWKPETFEKYEKKAQCFVDQYNSFTIEEVGLKVNGKSTLSENIADNGGARAAYRAYDEWASRNGREPRLPGLDYTPRQMFWISAASTWCSKKTSEELKRDVLVGEHAPSVARVVVTFANMPELARDFGCRVGSRINPVDRCTLW